MYNFVIKIFVIYKYCNVLTLKLWTWLLSCTVEITQQNVASSPVSVGTQILHKWNLQPKISKIS